MVKHKVFVFVVILSLILTGIAGAAPGPAGFANVPWGATADQVAREMEAQGFSYQYGGNPADKGYIWITYLGEMAGVTGKVSFGFYNNVFCEGAFHLNYDDNGIAEQTKYWKFLDFIQSQYGPSTESRREIVYQRLFNAWGGLKVPGSSDMVSIALIYSPGTSSDDPLELHYCNESLRDRLRSKKEQDAR